MSRMIAYRIQEEAFGGLDRETVRLLDRLARGEKPNELNRRLKPGTVLVREYRGERHTVTVVPDGFRWQDKTWSSLSTIAPNHRLSGPRDRPRRRRERNVCTTGTQERSLSPSGSRPARASNAAYELCMLHMFRRYGRAWFRVGCETTTSGA